MSQIGGDITKNSLHISTGQDATIQCDVPQFVVGSNGSKCDIREKSNVNNVNELVATTSIEIKIETDDGT